MTMDKTKAAQEHVWCGTAGPGEFVDLFLNALFDGRTAEAKEYLDPDLGRRSYGPIREILSFLEGDHWMFIPTPGLTPEGCELVRFVHLNDPEATLESGRPIMLDMVDFEIQASGNRSIVRVGPKRWETSDLTA